jgi:trk system potassium uptake protein
MARVSNSDYISRPVQEKKEIGISYMICPELVMAEELARTLYFPSMLMNKELAGGVLELIEFKVAEEMAIFGPVEEAAFPKNCRILAINRAGEIIIPGKDESIIPQDHLILICDPKSLPELRDAIHEVSEPHRVMIVGGGMVGLYLASRLERAGFDLKLIEFDLARCKVVADAISSTMVLNGDGTDISLLKEENAGEMDAVFAVTGVDEKNLLCSLLAKQLGAKKILSRVNRNAYIKLFELVGVDRAVSPGQVTADAVLQRVLGGEEVITLSDERIELIDFIVRAGAPIIGREIERDLPRGAVLGMILRDGKPIAPEENVRIQVGDRAIHHGHSYSSIQGQGALRLISVKFTAII